MPTYEYVCKSCGDHLEVVQSFKDAPLTECPACGGPLRKVFGSIGIVFKGTGFYRTDSRTPAKTEKTETTDKKEPAKAESTSTDSKSGSDAVTGSSGAAKADGASSSSSSKVKPGEKSA